VKTKTDPLDHAFMQIALGLARRGLGNTHPNPAVGCVLVRPDWNNRVVGRGWTQPGGRPHAETIALEQAGDCAKGATAYVTLEPCCHHGQTPPCSEALITAGINRVVIALEDPDPRVSGQGIAALEKAGLEVATDVSTVDATYLNMGFISRILLSRPFITLKTATTLDGQTATSTGHSQWITGPQARTAGHRLRATNDAILTGIGTILADDPQLTCRLPGCETQSPVRIILDAELSITTDHTVIKSASAEQPVWIFTSNATTPPAHAESLMEIDGVRVAASPEQGAGYLDLVFVARCLAEEGINRLLIESGGAVATSFITAGLVDEIVWFRSASLIGGDGKPAFGELGVDTLDSALGLERISARQLGSDMMETYVVKRDDQKRG